MASVPSFDDLARGYTTAAERDLEPIVQEAQQALRMREPATGQLRSFLARAWMAGAAAAAMDEAVAEGARVALELRSTLLDGPPDTSANS
jgi:hypothetical protein